MFAAAAQAESETPSFNDALRRWICPQCDVPEDQRSSNLIYMEESEEVCK
jgi:rubredoxin